MALKCLKNSKHDTAKTQMYFNSQAVTAQSWFIYRTPSLIALQRRALKTTHESCTSNNKLYAERIKSKINC